MRVDDARAALRARIPGIAWRDARLAERAEQVARLRGELELERARPAPAAPVPSWTPPTPLPPLQPGSEQDAFGHGYLVLGPGVPVPAACGGWPVHDVGGLRYVCHPRTVLASAAGPEGCHVVVLGHPVDTESASESIDQQQIARRAADRLGQRAHDASVESFTRYVGELGGRHTVYGHRAGLVVVVPDTCATQSVYWASGTAGAALSTHAELTAAAVGAEVDQAAIRRLHNISRFNTSSSRYFAGVQTSHQGVRPLMANCRLRWWPSTGEVRHERFYPWGEVRPGTADEVYGEFRDRFNQHCRLLCGFGRTGLSLTCGDDSRTTLFGVLPHLGAEAFAFTYLNPEALSGNHLDDLFVASRLAFELGLAHQVGHARVPQPGDLFHTVFTTTWSAYTPPPGGACAMYESLPRDVVHLQSTLAEVGTVSTRRRDDEPPTPAKLAGLFQGKGARQVPAYPAAFEEFLAYSEFDPSRMAGYDWHDLFYWEHRLTRWTAQKAHEGDLAQRVLHPFNSRPLIETMHRLPLADRQAKVLLLRTIADGGRQHGVGV